jgi:hypothetical protein
VPLQPDVPRTVDPTAVGPRGNAPNVFRSAVAVRLLVRLEDFSNDGGDQAQSEGKPAKKATSSAQDQLTQLQALQNVRRASGDTDPQLDAQVALQKRKVAAGKSGRTGTSNAAAPAGVGGDDLSIELAVVPAALVLKLNGFRTADTCDFDIALTDLPLPPDIVRSLFVEVYADEVAVNDHTDPTRWVPKLFSSAPLFRGYADMETLDADASRLLIAIQAQSLEARLIASKINPFTKERRIEKGGETLVHYVQKLISTIPEFNGTLGQAAIGVRLFPNVDPASQPMLNAALFKRSLQSAQSRAQAGGQVQAAPPAGGTGPGDEVEGGTPVGVAMPSINPATADVSVWDVITRAANLSGYIPIYDPSIVARTDAGGIEPIGANNILLIKPQNLKETPQDGVTLPAGPIDGFEREIGIGGTSTIRSQVRMFVWGHNIRSMKMARKYGREKAPRVRVVCHNPDGPPGQRTLEAVFPKALRGTSISARGGGAAGGKGSTPINEEVVRVVYEIRRQAELDKIAAALYHSIGQREIVCTIETDDLSSYVDPQRPETRNADMFRLRPGSPVRVLVARQVLDPASTDFIAHDLCSLFERRSNPAFLRKMLTRSQTFNQPGLDIAPRVDKMLEKIERTFQSAKLTDFFYTKTVELRWGPEGCSFGVELANYQDARNNPRKLSKDDRTIEDAEKAIKPGVKPDARAAAIEENLDLLLTQILGGQ